MGSSLVCPTFIGVFSPITARTPLRIPLGKANEIEASERRYGALVRGLWQEEELSGNLQALYEALWAPIGKALDYGT
jgi:hypothetical protein